MKGKDRCWDCVAEQKGGKVPYKPTPQWTCQFSFTVGPRQVLGMAREVLKQCLATEPGPRLTFGGHCMWTPETQVSLGFRNLNDISTHPLRLSQILPSLVP